MVTHIPHDPNLIPYTACKLFPAGDRNNAESQNMSLKQYVFNRVTRGRTDVQQSISN